MAVFRNAGIPFWRRIMHAAGNLLFFADCRCHFRERQWIAIARAILKNAPILILDEATSALDSESERYIQETLAELMENRTVIAVAHRLSTLKRMDKIVVLENGRIAEEGTHEKLMRKRGVYHKFYSMQTDISKKL